MKKIILLSMLCFMCMGISAQDNLPSVSTIANDGRFEIIQSPLARKYTIKIDKQTGDTWQLVSGKGSEVLWQAVYKSPAYPDTQKENCINYQIFFSGITAKDMFLLNVNTGTTWKLVHDNSENTDWWMKVQTL